MQPVDNPASPGYGTLEHILLEGPVACVAVNTNKIGQISVRVYVVIAKGVLLERACLIGKYIGTGSFG